MRLVSVTLALLMISVGAALASDSSAVQTGSSKIIIRDNIIKDSGIGIYVGRQRTDEILILNNWIINNGEGIRWASSTQGLIEYNEIRDNIIGFKVIGEYIGPDGKPVPLVVSSAILRLNNLVDNKEYAFLNLTEVPILADSNFWGSPGGPLWNDQPKSKLERPERHVSITLLPVLELSGFGLYRLQDSLGEESSLPNPGWRLSDLLSSQDASVLVLRGSIAQLHQAQPVHYIYEYEEYQTQTQSLPDVIKGLAELSTWLTALVKSRDKELQTQIDGP